VLAGKKFCTKCGNPITQVALRTETLNDVVESLNSAKESTSLITELPLTTEAPVAVDVNRDPEDSGKPVKMSVSSPERMDIPEETPTLAIPEADADADMVAPPASTAADEPFSASPESATRKGPSHFLILLGGVAACLLVIAIAVSLYISHNKPASPAAPATASKASQNSPPASISEANKPSAAKHGSEETVNAGNEAPQAKASAQALEAPSRIDAKQKSSTEVAVSPIPKEPVTKLPERRTAATSQSSGTLHYAGAPVHFGETVTFTNLPSAQLKFTFDHRAWRPLISRQSDGTKKLTLRSLKRVEQTTCDVAWEVMPESANSELVQKTSERCEILPSDISNYLDRADRDRAAGHYVDAARQYSKVIECDSNNATARQGLTRTRQAQAASGRDSE
jgi:hypothetical protein